MVSAGQGIGAKENMKLIEDLAKAAGAAQPLQMYSFRGWVTFLGTMRFIFFMGGAKTVDELFQADHQRQDAGEADDCSRPRSGKPSKRGTCAKLICARNSISGASVPAGK